MSVGPFELQQSWPDRIDTLLNRIHHVPPRINLGSVPTSHKSRHFDALLLVELQGAPMALVSLVSIKILGDEGPQYQHIVEAVELIYHLLTGEGGRRAFVYSPHDVLVESIRELIEPAYERLMEILETFENLVM